MRTLILMATRRRVPKQDPGNARSRGSESLRTAKRRQQRERAAVRKQKEHRKLDWLLDKYARGWRKRTRTAGPVPVTGLQGVAIDIARLIAEFDPLRARLEVRLQIKLDEFKQLRSGGVFYWFRPLRTARFRFASGTGILGKISAVSTVAAALCNGDAQQVGELLMATKCPRDGIRVRVIARTSGCMCLNCACGCVTVHVSLCSLSHDRNGHLLRDADTPLHRLVGSDRSGRSHRCRGRASRAHRGSRSGHSSSRRRRRPGQ